MAGKPGSSKDELQSSVVSDAEQPTQMERKPQSPLAAAEERLNDALYDLQQAEVALRNARAEEKRARADVARIRRMTLVGG